MSKIWKRCIAGFEGSCSTYTSTYKTTQRDKTTESLVVLGTIYSTTILAGDANIGIPHGSVVAKQNGMSQYL